MAEKRLNAALNAGGQTPLRAVNAGPPATSVSSIIQLLLKPKVTREPAILILNYSPAGFYHFAPRPARDGMDVTSQDYLDEGIRAVIKQYLYTFDQPWRNLVGRLFLLQNSTIFLARLGSSSGGYTRMASLTVLCATTTDHRWTRLAINSTTIARLSHK